MTTPTTWVPDPVISAIQVQTPSGAYTLGRVEGDPRGNWRTQGGNRPELAQGEVWTATFADALDVVLAYDAALATSETTLHQQVMNILAPPE